MRVSKRPYGVSGPLSTHTEVKPRSGTSLESIKSLNDFHVIGTFGTAVLGMVTFKLLRP